MGEELFENEDKIIHHMIELVKERLEEDFEDPSFQDMIDTIISVFMDEGLDAHSDLDLLVEYSDLDEENTLEEWVANLVDSIIYDLE